MKPGIELASFDFVKDNLLRDSEEENLTPIRALGVGALARIIATTIVYPYIRMKTLVNTGSGTGVGILKTLLDTLGNEGITGLYTGIIFEQFRGASQSAVMFLIMERLRALIIENFS